MSEIFGIDKVIERRKLIEFDDKIFNIREMNVLEYLKYTKDEYNTENIDSLIELVNDCCGTKFNILNIEDKDVYLIVFLFNSVIELQSDKEKEKIESDYEYNIDYSYYIARFMRYYSYKLEDVYKLSHRVFMELLGHIKAIEAEEDIRVIKIENAIKSMGNKSSTVYSDFIRMLSDQIKRVVNVRMTAKANLRQWRQFNGVNELKKHLDKKGGE